VTLGIVITFLPWIITPESHSPEELRSEYLVNSIALSNGVIEYEERGVGDTAILLISGFTIPMYIWDKQFDTLADRGWRTIRYNYYGRGYSDYIDGSYDRESYRDQAIELLDSLQVDRVILFGHSFGGVVASEITLANPERVVSLALLDPMLDQVSDNFGAKIVRFPILGSWLSRLILGRGVEGRANGLLTEARVSDVSEYRDQFRIERETKGFHRSLYRAFNGDALENYRAGYERVGMLDLPVFIANGTAELSTSPVNIETIAELFPNAERLTVPKACHLVHFDYPELVNDALFDFLPQRIESPSDTIE